MRFIGAGAIGAAAIWTLAKLAAPVWAGLASAMRASSIRSSGEGESLPRTERDIPIWIVGATILGSLVPLAVLFHSFLSAGPLESMLAPLM